MPKLYPGYRDEIRKKIVKQAFTVFLEKGFEKTTIDDVAVRLGVTKPAIYRYYKSKEELFLASMAETMMEEFKRIFASSFASDDLITGVCLFFDEFLLFNQKYSIISKDVDKIISRNATLRQGVEEFHLDGLEFMQHFFMEQKMKGTIHTTTDYMDLAHICSALAHGLINQVSMGLNPVEAKRLWLIGFTQLVGIQTGKDRCLL